MLCWRTTADKFVDYVINHPEVRPTAQPGTTTRLTSLEVLTDHRNRCYGGNAGVVLFIGLQDDVYDGHVFLLPEGRGAGGLAFGKSALRALFADVPVRNVVCRVPWELPAARWYVRRLGFVSQGRRPEQSVELFEMEKFNG